jgi:hypothetical protein
MGLGTLWALYRLGRIAFPERPGVAVGMMGLVAFTPQFLFLSSSVSNDNAVILAASWALVLMAGWLRAPRLPGWLPLGALGAVLGLGLLAKLSGLLLWPLAAGVIAWLAWRERDARWLIRAGLVVFGVAALLGGWWLVRNVLLYGEFTGSSALVGALGGYRQHLPSSLGSIVGEFRGFRFSLWALFGWFNVLAPDVFYLIMDVLTALGAVGFWLYLVRCLRWGSDGSAAIVVMLLVWLGLVGAAVVNWAILATSQGRLAYPALGALSMILVVGWAELVPRRVRRPVGLAALAAWGVCAALAAAYVLRPAYALPVRAGSMEELSIEPSPLLVRYGDCCELAGYLVEADEPAHSGERVPLTLVWRVVDEADRDYSLFVHALTEEGEVVGQLDTYPGNGLYPTSQWQPGEVIVDTMQVPLDMSAEAPNLVRFHVGLYELEAMEKLPAFSRDGGEVEAVFAGEAALAPHQWPQPRRDPAMDTVFEAKIRLSAVELPAEEVFQGGDALTVTLEWEGLDRIGEDYTGFVHLVGPSGSVVAQDDHPPREGGYPTRLWTPGVVLLDSYRIELPGDLESGHYELWAGLYRPGTGRRLAAFSAGIGARRADDLVNLGSVRIGDGDG